MLADEFLLTQLRRGTDWPSQIDALAAQAAALGRLIEADSRAASEGFEHIQGSSQSSERPSQQATYYARLEQALRQVLGQ